MEQCNILLLCGGEGSEHEISLVSASYLEQQLKTVPGFGVIRAVIRRDGWTDGAGGRCALTADGRLRGAAGDVKIDCAVPCLHGFPGETGDIQSVLELAGVPYVGCGPEASMICFNKVTAKLWFDALGIPNTPWCFLYGAGAESLRRAHAFFAEHGAVFVKAASQGSSVGCYRVGDESGLDEAVAKAFGYSADVLIEKAEKPRELEVAAYEYGGELVVTNPGEIITPDSGFYTYEEKYAAGSQSVTVVEADLPESVRAEIREYARKAFLALKLRDLSRIDFFLAEDGRVLLNEINTFPGMTPISMFPKMLEHHGETMSGFLRGAIAAKLGKR